MTENLSEGMVPPQIESVPVQLQRSDVLTPPRMPRSIRIIRRPRRGIIGRDELDHYIHSGHTEYIPGVSWGHSVRD